MVKFSKSDEFSKEIRKKVNDYFTINQKSSYADWFFYLKTIMILLLFSCSFAGLFLINGNGMIWYLNWAFLGLMSLIIGLNIVHDAQHNAISRNRFINKTFGKIIKILGFNDHLWRLMHNQQHHIHTNNEGIDPDLVDIGIIRFSPYQKWRKIHKYQHIYALPLYSLQTMVWIFKTDFQKMFGLKKLDRLIWIDFIFSKCLYIVLFLVLPTVHRNGEFANVLFGFICMHLVFGFLSTLIFLVSHLVLS